MVQLTKWMGIKDTFGGKRTIKASVLWVTILLIIPSLQACASAKLTHVMVGERIATGSDLYDVKVFREDEQ